MHTIMKQGLESIAHRVISTNARHRWLVSGVALLATGTIAAIQHSPSNDLLPESALIISGTQEFTQVPGPDGGMRTAANILPVRSMALGHVVAEDQSTYNWHRLEIERGDNLASLLKSRKLYTPEIHHTLTTNAVAYSLNNLAPGKVLRIGLDRGGILDELSYEVSDNTTVVMSRKQDGSYGTQYEHRQYDQRNAYVSGVIEDSLFVDGKRAGMSDRLIMDLATIFGWDIDFALDLRRGDRFTVIYEEKFWRGEKIEDGRIVAAEFLNQGKRYRAVASKDKDGIVRYYTPSGNSMERQFLRTPVQFSRISSRYTNGRYHPILKRWRAHKGVDYAARRGTPVRATAAGRILERRRKGGYGNTVVIRHGGKYSTLYAHLSRYQRGQRAGSLVKQGEIIGYVGSTGLATGPHLHYEFLVYGRHRNPLTVRLPRSRPIADSHKQEFIQLAQGWIETLDRLNGQVQLAQNTR